jgi:hypothetical protein
MRVDLILMLSLFLFVSCDDAAEALGVAGAPPLYGNVSSTVAGFVVDQNRCVEDCMTLLSQGLIAIDHLRGFREQCQDKFISQNCCANRDPQRYETLDIIIQETPVVRTIGMCQPLQNTVRLK